MGNADYVDALLFRWPILRAFVSWLAGVTILGVCIFVGLVFIPRDMALSDITLTGTRTEGVILSVSSRSLYWRYYTTFVIPSHCFGTGTRVSEPSIKELESCKRYHDEQLVKSTLDTGRFDYGETVPVLLSSDKRYAVIDLPQMGINRPLSHTHNRWGSMPLLLMFGLTTIFFFWQGLSWWIRDFVEVRLRSRLKRSGRRATARMIAVEERLKVWEIDFRFTDESGKTRKFVYKGVPRNLASKLYFTPKKQWPTSEILYDAKNPKNAVLSRHLSAVLRNEKPWVDNGDVYPR